MTSVHPPTLSVVLTTFNGARFLGPQLDSLVAQSRRPDEMVVCDDGSSDGTLEILEDFHRNAPFPVRLHRNPTRLGYADNFLHACTLAQGELLAPCDQDDVWQTAKLERCVAALTAGPGVLLAMHSAEVVDVALKPRGFCKPDFAFSGVLHPRGGELDFSLPGFSMVFAADLIRKFDWRNRARDYMKPDRPPMAPDQWLPFLARATGQVALLADRLVLYRQHDHNTCGAEDLGGTPRSNLLRSANESAYRQRAEASAYYGDFLAALRPDLGAPWRDTLQSSAERYRRQAAVYAARSRLYDSNRSRWRGLRTYATLCRLGAYRSRAAGGLGWRAAVKDAGSLLLSEHFTIRGHDSSNAER